MDGGRSHAIRHSLERLLRDIRQSLGAEIVFVLYHGQSGEPHARALACSSGERDSEPLPNEPFWLGEWSTSPRPRSRHRLILRSALRPYELRLVSGLVIPWSHTSGRGWLVAGMSRGSNSGKPDLTAARRHAARLRDAHVLAGLRGATRLQREIARAAEALAEAELDACDTASLLEAVASGARSLLGTSAAYVALPTPGGGFTMTAHLNVRTATFRRLTLLQDQGLGGLTNRERRTIISSNYPEDRRLLDPPIAESLREGFLSAMCVPLIGDEEVIGLLYTANRHLTPFTEADAAVLEEYGRFAALALRRVEAEQHRQAVLRRLEQERLAFELHDSIVRTLIEIGYEAEAGLRFDDSPSLRHRFERIGRATETCLQAIREQIASMVNPANALPDLDLGAVLAAIDSSQSALSAPRTLRLRGAAASHPLPARIAASLISIGREAVQNADLHASASHVDVLLEVTSDRVVLVVSDDGEGMAPQLAVDETSGHLGLLRMRKAAAEAGGLLALGPSEQGGVRVEARLPLR